MLEVSSSQGIWKPLLSRKQPRFFSERGQDCDSTSVPKAGERESTNADILGGAQTLQCTDGCKETPGLVLPALDVQPPSPGAATCFLQAEVLCCCPDWSNEAVTSSCHLEYQLKQLQPCKSHPETHSGWTKIEMALEPAKKIC